MTLSVHYANINTVTHLQVHNPVCRLSEGMGCKTEERTSSMYGTC